MTEHLQKSLLFISEMEKLKKVQRRNKTLDSGRFENSAEHSWHVALMAFLLKDYFSEGIDITKVVKMLLIHDVVEIDTGDTFLYHEREKMLVEHREENAAYRLFGLLPAPEKDEYLSLWLEFEDGVTPEAECAAVLDALQPLINHLITRNENENPFGLTWSQVIEKKNFIKSISPELWEVAQNLIIKSVEKGLYEK